MMVTNTINIRFLYTYEQLFLFIAVFTKFKTVKFIYNILTKI